jgi:hypothetical protein
MTSSLASAALLAWAVAGAPGPATGKYFKITVVDEQTGRGVPLVELRTVDEVRRYTDSNGVVAFSEPGLMGRKVFFHVRSHGYEFPKDGFGFRGRALDVKEGGSVRLTIRRVNIAERLYRVTGAGIYRDSVLVGQPVPLKQPLLNGQVVGQDSVVSAAYRGKLCWFWGDTNRPGYPLGNFQVSGATSRPQADGGLDPSAGVDLEYFVNDDGFAREMAPLPGKGPTWISGLCTVPGDDGKERLFAAYAKIRGQLTVYARGLVEYNDEKQRFEKVADFPLKSPALPGGHTFRRSEGGVEYVYFASPYPLVRVSARPADLRLPARYQAFTCLKEGSRLDRPQLDRAADGTLRYGWKVNTPPVGAAEQARLIKAGLLKPAEALLQLQNADTGVRVTAHGGSVCWNAYRKRWVLIAVQSFGTSILGEVWYAEADTPAGPWAYARKVVGHDRYDFYNPTQHPFFDQEGGRLIYFEGTYAHTYSGNPYPTPRYDCNQIMYRLNLADPRLVLPVPVYALPAGDVPCRFATARQADAAGKELRIAFFALDRAREGAVPVYARPAGKDGWALQAGGEPPGGPGGKAPVFYALPARAKKGPVPAVPLYEFLHEDGVRRAYSTDPAWAAPGFRRAEQPLCRVWRDPMPLAGPWKLD